MFDACECELDGHQNCYDDMSKNQHSFYIDSVLNEMFCDDDEGMYSLQVLRQNLCRATQTPEIGILNKYF